MQLVKLAGLLTDACVRSMGGQPSGAYHLRDHDLVQLLLQDAGLRARSGIDPVTLTAFAMHIKDPLRVAIHRADGTVTLEDALEFFRARLESRLETVPEFG